MTTPRQRLDGPNVPTDQRRTRSKLRRWATSLVLIATLPVVVATNPSSAVTNKAAPPLKMAGQNDANNILPIDTIVDETTTSEEATSTIAEPTTTIPGGPNADGTLPDLTVEQLRALVELKDAYDQYFTEHPGEAAEAGWVVGEYGPPGTPVIPDDAENSSSAQRPAGQTTQTVRAAGQIVDEPATTIAETVPSTTPPPTTTRPATTPPPPPTVPPPLPTAAVALGDSFISGEGAGDYLPVVDINGVSQSFPGWTAPNNNAFFCHRSANAEIQVAAIANVSARFNLACSGGQPRDIQDASAIRPKGRMVASQLDQLRAIAQTNNIDLVLVGVGSNNSSFTFGDLVVKCVSRFVAGGYIDWALEFLVRIRNSRLLRFLAAHPWLLPRPVRLLIVAGLLVLVNKLPPALPDQRPCSSDDFASASQLAALRAEATNSMRQIVDTVRAVDVDGKHRIIFQDYTNPIAPTYASNFYEEGGHNDGNDYFKALVQERYRAGCPLHVSSTQQAHVFSSRLNDVIRDIHATARTEYPNEEITYLHVEHAFDGARICETNSSPNGAIATPVRVQGRDAAGQPTGSFLTDLPSKLKDIAPLQEGCGLWYQTCQETLHPNAQGHAALGQCLSQSLAYTAAVVYCNRDPLTGQITTQPREPYMSIITHGQTSLDQGWGNQRVHLSMDYNISLLDGAGEQITAVNVEAFTYTPNFVRIPLGTSTSSSGSFYQSFDCPTRGSGQIFLIITATTNRGRTLYGSASETVYSHMNSC